MHRTGQTTDGRGNGETVPRVIAVEVIRRCNLACIHCRATAAPDAPEGELSLEDYRALFDDVASFSAPILILTGGEPLLRPDLYDLAAHATGLGLRVAVSTNGTLVDERTAGRLKAAGVRTCSISIDGSTPEIHDDFRRQPGAFEASVRGMRLLIDAGIQVQVNSSLTRRNMGDLEKMFETARRLGASAWHLFMIVPTGRAGETGTADLISADDYERILNRVYEWNRDETIEIKPTCAPQYYRILRQRARAEGIPVDEAHFGLNARTRGCLAGTGFAFVSYRGEVLPCGYYARAAGEVTRQPFREIWERSPLFVKLRDPKRYEGYCGRCPFLKSCGGCRARAYALTGDDMAEEPYCRFKETR